MKKRNNDNNVGKINLHKRFLYNAYKTNKFQPLFAPLNTIIGLYSNSGAGSEASISFSITFRDVCYLDLKKLRILYCAIGSRMALTLLTAFSFRFTLVSTNRYHPIKLAHKRTSLQKTFRKKCMYLFEKGCNSRLSSRRAFKILLTRQGKLESPKGREASTATPPLLPTSQLLWSHASHESVHTAVISCRLSPYEAL